MLLLIIYIYIYVQRWANLLEIGIFLSCYNIYAEMVDLLNPTRFEKISGKVDKSKLLQLIQKWYFVFISKRLHQNDKFFSKVQNMSFGECGLTINFYFLQDHSDLEFWYLSLDQIELFNHLLRIIIIRFLKPYSLLRYGIVN